MTKLDDARVELASAVTMQKGALTKSQKALAALDAAIAEQQPPPPPPPPPTSGPPNIEVDFSRFGSTTEMMADPRFTTGAGEVFNPAQIALDGGAMKYLYPDKSMASDRCSGYTIGRNLMLASPQSEIAVEMELSFDPAWEFAPSWYQQCSASYNPDFKLLIGRVSIDGPSSTFRLMFGNGIGGDIVLGYSGNEAAFRVPGARNYLDGQKHVFRIHWKHSTTAGVARLWIDGVKLIDPPPIAMAFPGQTIYGLALGRNRDPSPGREQWMKWHGFDVWYGGNLPAWAA